MPQLTKIDPRELVHHLEPDWRTVAGKPEPGEDQLADRQHWAAVQFLVAARLLLLPCHFGADVEHEVQRCARRVVALNVDQLSPRRTLAALKTPQDALAFFQRMAALEQSGEPAQATTGKLRGHAAVFRMAVTRSFVQPPKVLAELRDECVAEFSGHWDRLGPTPDDTVHMQAILRLVGPHGCKAKSLAEGLFKQGWGGSRNRARNYRLTPDAGELVNAMIPRLLHRTGSGGHSRYVLGCAPAGVPTEIRAHLWPRQE